MYTQFTQAQHTHTHTHTKEESQANKQFHGEFYPCLALLPAHHPFDPCHGRTFLFMPSSLRVQDKPASVLAPGGWGTKREPRVDGPVKAPWQADTKFGEIGVNDWAILDAPSTDAALVGHTQGTHVQANKANSDGWYVSFSLVFENGR
jgi:hypothetical protein